MTAMRLFAEYKLGDIISYNKKEWQVIKFQPEGIRLKGTKNNPLGNFEIVINENELKLNATCGKIDK